jgi:8-oxo-dGTP pyrophosphatase MutT (NUDIX family)
VNTFDKETLDLVDDKDEVIGTIDRAEYDRMVAQNLGYIRSVELLIRNSKGKYWIPTRTADKKIAPNGLDYSMGGHVDAGEEYIEAALREIREELNLFLKPEDIIFITKFPPDLIHYFRVVYLYETDDTPEYNPADFVKAEWLSLKEIEQRLESGIPAKRNLLMTIQEVEKHKL